MSGGGDGFPYRGSTRVPRPDDDREALPCVNPIRRNLSHFKKFINRRLRERVMIAEIPACRPGPAGHDPLPYFRPFVSDPSGSSIWNVMIGDRFYSMYSSTFGILFFLDIYILKSRVLRGDYETDDPVGVLAPGMTLPAGSVERLNAGAYQEMKNLTGNIQVSLNGVAAARRCLKRKDGGCMMK
jgi:hypothetical protein